MFFSKRRAQTRIQIELLDELEGAIENRDAPQIARWLETHKKESFFEQWERKSELIARAVEILWLDARDELWRLLEIKTLSPYHLVKPLENLAEKLSLEDLISLVHHEIWPSQWRKNMWTRFLSEPDAALTHALLNQIGNGHEFYGSRIFREVFSLVAQRNAPSALEWLKKRVENWQNEPHEAARQEILGGLVKRDDAIGRAFLERLFERNREPGELRRAIAVRVFELRAAKGFAGDPGRFETRAR